MFVPVLSRSFVVRGAARALPTPSTGSTRPPAFATLGSSGRRPAAAGFQSKSPGPDPQSQFISRSYEPILPTSLIYIVLSTRGCSPWKPDAVFVRPGKIENAPPDFQGPSVARRIEHRCSTLPNAGPYLRMIRFQGLRFVRKKRELFPGPPPASPGSPTSPSSPWPGTGILTRFPFDGLHGERALDTGLPHLLGSTHPCPIAVHKEPFSTSVFKVRI